jgi:hypothetical protein
MSDNFKDPNTELAGVYATRPASTAMGQATGRDYSNTYSRATVQDGQVVSTETGSQSRSSLAAIADEANRASNVPWSRAIDSRGNHVAPSQVNDDTRVTLPGVGEMTMRQAIAAGFLTKGNSAPFESPASVNRLTEARQARERDAAMDTPFTENTTPKPETHPDLETQPFADPGVEQTVSELVSNVSGSTQLAAIQQIVESGQINALTLGRAASEMMIEPDQLNSMVAPVIAAAEQQARAVMSDSAMGLDAQQVVEFAQQHRRDALNGAMNKQASQRTTKGYAELKQDYILSLGELYPDRALAADVGPNASVYKDAKGRVMVKVAGTDMTWRTAVKAFGPK